MSALALPCPGARCLCGWPDVEPDPPPVVDAAGGRVGRFGPDARVVVTDEWVRRARRRAAMPSAPRDFHARIEGLGPDGPELAVGSVLRFVDHGAVSSVYRVTERFEVAGPGKGGSWLLVWPD